MNKKILLFASLCFLLTTSYGNSTSEAFFNRQCEGAINKNIAHAKKSIRVAVYSFTRYSIAGKLAGAAKKGIDVQIILDKKQLEYESSLEIVQILRQAGVKVFIYEKADQSSMHHKFMVIDKQTVITGSFNYTTSASKYNSENIVVLKDSNVAEKFKVEWGNIKAECQKTQKKPQK